MNFRIKFNLSEMATESLIKFMKFVLREIDDSEFNFFSNSLYLTRKILGLQDKFHSFVTYPKCYKLYNKQDVIEFQENENIFVMKCNHIKFSNSTNRRIKSCKIELSKKSKLLNG